MKNNTILFTLLLTLSVQLSFAQRTLPRGARPYAANWTWTLVKSMHRAGFDMPTMAATPQTGKVESRNELQLDSTLTFYGYNLNGPGDSTPLFRSIYTYPQPNEKTETNYQNENGEWIALNRTTFTADDQERLVVAIAEGYDPAEQAFLPDSWLEIFPHGDSPDLVDSVKAFAWDPVGGSWQILLYVVNTFNDEDRLLENITTIHLAGDVVVFKEIYSYDANGDNHLIEEFAILGTDEFPSGRTEITYVDHQPLEVTVFTHDGIDFQRQSRANYAYTLFGALRLTLSFEWDPGINDWRMTQRIEYGFDGQQRVASKKTTFITPGAADELELVAYAYVEGEDLYSEMFFLWNDDLFDWILDSKKLYYYNGITAVDPDPVAVQALKAWPNPTTAQVQLSFDSEAEVKVYDPTGQLVQSRLVQPGQALDLSALPAGMYAVMARQGADFYSGKIVKQ